ncbi:Pup--protein ligase [Streptomyces glaucescens]
MIELVTHDKAGERILEGLLVDAERRLHEEGIAGDVYLFKNNTDSAGNSYGCHENYLVARHGEFSRLADILIPFLVTRQLLCGAGKVLQTPRGAVYCVSQRAEHIWEGVSSATTRSRPIINTRDEPHADAERYRRLHVIVGDSNMSETTMLLKVGATDLVLRMIEAGTVMRDLTLENPIRAIREVSHDITGRRKVRLASGREASALEVQREYYEKALDFCERRGIRTGTVEQVLELWGRTLDAIESEDLDRIDTEIDWVMKYKLIERYRAKHNMTMSHPRVAQIDLAYHDIHRRRGLYYLLEKKGQAARICNDLKIFEGKSVPPQTTRARLRGDFIRRAQEQRRDFTVDWVHLKLQRPGTAHRVVQGPVPFGGRPGGEADRRNVTQGDHRTDPRNATRAPYVTRTAPFSRRRVARTPSARSTDYEAPIVRRRSLMIAVPAGLVTLAGCGDDKADSSKASDSPSPTAPADLRRAVAEDRRRSAAGDHRGHRSSTRSRPWPRAAATPSEGSRGKDGRRRAAAVRSRRATTSRRTTWGRSGTPRRCSTTPTTARRRWSSSSAQGSIIDGWRYAPDRARSWAAGSSSGIPPAWGYGEQGQSQAGIKGTDTLVFVVDLQGTFNATSSAKGTEVAQDDTNLPKVGTNTDGKAPSVEIPKTDPPKKLVANYVIEGDGTEVGAQDSVLVQYKGVQWTGGKEFDSTYGRKALTSFSLQQVVKGWSQGLTGKKVGSRRADRDPAGPGVRRQPAGRAAASPKGATLVFTVDILAKM